MLITWRKAFALLAAASMAVAFAPSGAAVHASTPDSGWARFGHFAPSAEPVNVTVDGQPFATNISFKTVSDYVALPAGPHEFELRPISNPDGPSVFHVEANVPSGGAVTIGAVTTLDGIAAQVYDDKLVSPPAGESLVRFIHAAPDAAEVAIGVVDGPVLAGPVPYPAATDYLPIASGPYNVEVRDVATGNLLVRVDGWSIEPGAQASIVIVKGLDGNLDVAPLIDAAAVASMPAGGVQTGYGGMASARDSSSSLDVTASVLLVVVVVVAGSLIALGVSRRRRLTTLTR